MKYRLVGVTLAILFALAIAPVALAQPPAPIVPNPTAGAGAPPAPTTTPAPAPEWKVTSLSPATIVSDPKKDVAKGVHLSGKALDKLDWSKVALTDEAGTDLTFTIADNSNLKSYCLSIEVDANASGKFTLTIDGEATKLVLTIKNAEQVEHEKIVAQAAAGASAAVKVKGLEAQIAALRNEITALKTADVALGTRINGAQETATNAVNTATTALTTATTTATDVSALRADVKMFAGDLETLAKTEVKKSFWGGKRPLSEDLAARVAARLAAMK